MTKKTLLILANSLKRGGRCIAGREVIFLPDGRWHFGPWIRPVSSHGTGELAPAETIRPDGNAVAVMDFADVTLARNENDKCQPENWLITGPHCWSPVTRPCKLPPLRALEERPADLWIDRAEMSDRVSPHRLAEFPTPSSLCVIRPQELTLVWWAERNAATQRTQSKFRARFLYNGEKYELSLTDPLASERFCQPPAAPGNKPRTLALPRTDAGPLLCISLTPVFQGFHYKVAATILGIP